MIEWEDSSSFSRGEKDRTPKEYTTKIGQFTLVVHRHIHYDHDVWLATCDGLFGTVGLLSKNIDEAKCQATAHVQVILQNAIDDIVRK